MRTWRLVFAIWVFLWILFLVRGLYKGEFKEYKALLERDAEARRAYVVGEELYSFLEFALVNIPKRAAYELEGALKPIDRERLIYYLYPRGVSDNPEYILCYKVGKDSSRKNFKRFTALKKDQFILKRRAD